MTIKVRLVQHGEHEFEYTDEFGDATAIRDAVAGIAPGERPRGELHDVTDTDRSDADPEEWLAITEDGVPLWSGWLGTPPDPDPVAAGRADLERAVASMERSLYAAWIDVAQHHSITGATEILSEALDGYDGPEFNGTETGKGWLERTRAKDGAQ